MVFNVQVVSVITFSSLEGSADPSPRPGLLGG